jgi:putative ABC transport system substrate-binding protein
MGAEMKRREFGTLVGGAIAAIPAAIHAQQSMPRVVGMLSPEGPKTGNVDGLVQGLRELGYVEGRNIRFTAHRSGYSID